MSGFTEKNGVLCADNIPLSEIAKQFGTPAYVYAASSIRDQYEKLAGAMKKALPADRQPMLCYACKANSNIAILKLLQNMGSGLEIVSEGELHRGLKAGFDPGRIVSTGVGKQVSEIAEGLNAGIHQFNIESLPELEQIQKVASEMDKEATVVFRLNPDIANAAFSAKTSTGGKRDKFGISRKRIFEGFAMAKEMSHVKVVGLSTHIGSQISSVESFKPAFKMIAEIVTDLRAEGYAIERLDIGGGFPIVYDDEQLLDLDAYAQWVNDIIVPLETEIIMEPGRYLVGNAGVLLTEVLYVKETSDRNFLVIDGAMNDLIRPTLYDAYHVVEPVANRDAAMQTYDIVGPICETGDTFTTDRQMPGMKPGELAVIKSAGAYGFCMASNYNTRPLPPEILVDGDNVAVIRPRQGYDDIISLETIPEWLSQ